MIAGVAALLVLGTGSPSPQEDVPKKIPLIHPASEDAEKAIESIEALDGLEVSLFAAEPMLANPVCLTIADDGTVYIAETFRLHDGVTDIRERRAWLEDDLASRTVADRLAYMRKHAGEDFDDYAGAEDRVRRLRDTDGDGRADEATVFAGGFDKHESGLGSGLLARGNDVYYTCIPDLWLLRDPDGDGVADTRQQLSTGYGTNTCLLGHDLHGLRIGPDGLLYFSSGDRGFHVETENGVIAHPARGAVLRCRLDGSGLEVFHTGLRNPQELAFDDHGNLFTGDNNSDGGDKARWVEVVEGADSGWRYPYQWIDQPVARGPWNDEKLWHPHHEGQAAYIFPPLTNIADGPSGLTHYPGTGLGQGYTDHFFLCDFRGGRSYSGVHAFSMTPKGAGFEVGETRPFLWNCLPTDVEFAPGGGVYFTDWVSGWGMSGRGRVFHVLDPQAMENPIVSETAALLREGPAARTVSELGTLLHHADQRVRQAAQFELVERGQAGLDGLVTTALAADLKDRSGRIARLHGIWGVAMAAREHGAALEQLAPLFADPDPEIRAQMARSSGDLRCEALAEQTIGLLDDDNLRVRFRAGVACGNLADPRAVAPLLELARGHGADPYLRHAVVFGLDGCADDAALATAATDASYHVRMATLLVYRRREDARIAQFLADPELATEAARAINDVPIEAARAALADHIDDAGPTSSAWSRRVLNANYRLGGDDRARALAAFALREDPPPALRAEALEMLADWAEPRSIDRVDGAWRPLSPRDSATLLPALTAELLAGGIASAPEPVVRNWIELAAQAQAIDVRPTLADWVTDMERSSAVRVDALEALESLQAPDLQEVIDLALVDREGSLRAAALAALDRMAPELALPRVPRILEQGEFPERRVAYRILERLEAPNAQEILAGELERLAAEQVPAELVLDLIQAIEASGSTALLKRLEVRATRRAGMPALRSYMDGLFGGDTDRGRAVFHEKIEVNCVRCHASSSGETSRVGPSLTGVSKRLTRLQMLESIVDPNRTTSPGYDSTVLFLKGGGIVAGLIVEESEQAIEIVKSDGSAETVTPSDVETRKPDLSSMPEGLAESISRAEMRDLLEYLGSL